MGKMKKIEKETELTQKGISISTLIGNLRAYLQLSQAAFAEPLGLSPTHIARFEKGVSIPSQDTLDAICNAYQVDPEYFTETGIDVAIAVNRQNHEEGIARRLESARQERGWTQKELSVQSGVDRTVICRVESGAKLTDKQAVKLAEALEVGVEWLMHGDERRKSFPADQKMILWLWEREDVRQEIWAKMQASGKKGQMVDAGQFSQTETGSIVSNFNEEKPRTSEA